MLIAISPDSRSDAIDSDTGERLKFHDGKWVSLDARAHQRKPETGERLDGTPKPPEPGRCYLCFRNKASIYFSAAIPQCGTCFDRYRRRE